MKLTRQTGKKVAENKNNQKSSVSIKKSKTQILNIDKSNPEIMKEMCLLEIHKFQRHFKRSQKKALVKYWLEFSFKNFQFWNLTKLHFWHVPNSSYWQVIAAL